MEFSSLLTVAQKNAKTSSHSSERSKFYSTKFEPPKKEKKESKLSEGIKKFLAQKDYDAQADKEKKQKEYAELMASRSDRDKNKIRKMLKVTKSANRSVLDDAVSKTDTAVTLDGPEQPDEDDYGYTSNAADNLYKQLMDKYKSMPEDNKFSKTSLNRDKNGDLGSTKDRVRARIMQEKEDEKLGRKRTHTSTSTSSSTTTSGDYGSSSDPKRIRKNLYDPRVEREAEERKKREQEEEKRKKMRNKRPPPPVMDFHKLLKLAEEKQHQPVQVEAPRKTKEPERLLTEKEKKELEARKREMEERERRRNGIPSKPHTNGDKRQAQTVNGIPRIPKLNGASSSISKPSSSSTSSSSHSAPDSRKLINSSVKEPIKSTPSVSLNRTPSKPQSSISSTNSKNTNAPLSNGKRPVDIKSKNSSIDMQHSQQSKQNQPISKQPRPIDSKNIKPREFPPRDVVKSREFPPKDIIKSREFPPRDLVKSREFPPRDPQRNPATMKQKQLAASKRRPFIDDSDEDEYDSEMDDFIDDDEPKFDYSSEIRKMFGYDKSRYQDRYDDCHNMESTFAQQQREEFISKKAGMMEDLEDMRLEAEEKKQKALAKKRRRL